MEGLGVGGRLASYEAIAGVSGSPVSTVLRARVILVSGLAPVVQVSRLTFPTPEIVPGFPSALEGSGGEICVTSWTLSPETVRRQIVSTDTTHRYFCSTVSHVSFSSCQ